MAADTQTQQAHSERRAHERSNLERFLEGIADHAESSTLYGEPIVHDGVAVIPVARFRYALGGGGGAGPAGEHGTGRGAGRGAGVFATPVGFIELRGGEARFRRIDTGADWARALGFGFAFWLTLRSVRKLALAFAPRRSRLFR